MYWYTGGATSCQRLSEFYLKTKTITILSYFNPYVLVQGRFYPLSLNPATSVSYIIVSVLCVSVDDMS